MQTTIKRDLYNGLIARSRILLGFASPEGDAVLDISTSKSSRGILTTSASVNFIREGILTHAFPDDFSKTMNQATGKPRVTEKVLSEFHDESLRQAEAYTILALEHYGQDKEMIKSIAL